MISISFAKYEQILSILSWAATICFEISQKQGITYHLILAKLADLAIMKSG